MNDECPSLRFAFVSHEFPPLGGGAASALDATTRALARRGHAVLVLTLNATDATQRRVDDTGRTIVRLPGGHRRPLLAPSKLHLARSFWTLRNGMRELKQFPTDVVVAYFAVPAGLAATRATRRMGLPLVVSLRGSDVPGFSDRLPSALLKPLFRRALNAADAVVANGPHLAELAEQFGAGVAVTNAPNGVDPDLFFPEERAQNGPVRYLMVGQLIHRKRCTEAVEAFIDLAERGGDALLTLVGDGPLRGEVKRRIDSSAARSRVSMMGHVDRGLLPDVYRRHDVLVQLSRAEGVANAVLEGLASGLVVVASDEVAAGLGTESIGVVVDATSRHDVVAALEKAGTLAADRGGEASRRVARRFTWDRTAEELERVVRELLVSRSGATPLTP